MNNFDEFAESLSPHPTKARIILELADNDTHVQHALDILKDHGIDPVEHEILNKDRYIWIQLLLPSELLQESVLKLSEAGFTKVRGVSAQKRIL